MKRSVILFNFNDLLANPDTSFTPYHPSQVEDYAEGHFEYTSFIGTIPSTRRLPIAVFKNHTAIATPRRNLYHHYIIALSTLRIEFTSSHEKWIYNPAEDFYHG